MNLTKSVLISVLALSIAPHAVIAQSAPSYEPIKISLAGLSNAIFADEAPKLDETLELAVDPRLQPLREYLRSKNSPMAEHAGELLKHYHYRLIIGIAFAESNFCKRNIRPHNCWGIGGNTPERYESYQHAFTRANDLIQKYHDGGLTTPKLMRNRWVGWPNDKWIVAVNQVAKELETRGI